MIAYQTGHDEGHDYKREVPHCNKIAFRTAGKNRAEFTYRTPKLQREFLEGWMENWKETPTMNAAIVQEIVTLARQIAVYSGYNNLVNGLQPLLTLRTKFTRKLDELYTCYSHKQTPETDVYAEAGDCLYYAACAWEQGDEWPYWHLVAILQYFDLDMAKVEVAALAKYRYRASGLKKKDFAVERRLIIAALEDV